MRLGEEDEAKRQLLEQCWNAGYQSIADAELAQPDDSYKNFDDFKTPTTILKLEQEGSGAAAAVFASGAGSSHRHLREKVQVSC